MTSSPAAALEDVIREFEQASPLDSVKLEGRVGRASVILKKLFGNVEAYRRHLGPLEHYHSQMQDSKDSGFWLVTRAFV